MGQQGFQEEVKHETADGAQTSGERLETHKNTLLGNGKQFEQVSRDPSPVTLSELELPRLLVSIL